ELPLRLGGKATGGPRAVGCGVLPPDVGDGERGDVEARIARRKRGWRARRGRDAAHVILDRDFRRIDLEVAERHLVCMSFGADRKPDIPNALGIAVASEPERFLRAEQHRLPHFLERRSHDEMTTSNAYSAARRRSQRDDAGRRCALERAWKA